MVDIEFIKATSCPVCGCKVVVSESIETEFNTTKVRRHCNGGKWAHRKFACGYHVSYCPNYMAEEVVGKCALDPEDAIRAKKRADLKTSLINHIITGDCQDDYKERLLQAIKYV